MGPIRRKLSSLLTQAVEQGMAALDPESPCAKELGKSAVAKILREEIEKICTAATWGEISRAGLLVSRLQKASPQERGPVKADLGRIIEGLVTRVESESGKLRIPEACRRMLLEL